MSMVAAMYLLKGSVYEAQENWPLAARCYTSALQSDALCYEALDRLVSNHMISMVEQRELLVELEPKLQEIGAEWLRIYYRCKLEPDEGRHIAAALGRTGDSRWDDEHGSCGVGLHDSTPRSTGVATDAVVPSAQAIGDVRAVTGAIPETLSDETSRSMLELQDNCDMLTAAAEYEYTHEHFRTCYELTSLVLQKDPFQQQVLPVHICAMVCYVASSLLDPEPKAKPNPSPSLNAGAT